MCSASNDEDENDHLTALNRFHYFGRTLLLHRRFCFAADRMAVCVSIRSGNDEISVVELIIMMLASS